MKWGKIEPWVNMEERSDAWMIAILQLAIQEKGASNDQIKIFRTVCI